MTLRHAISPLAAALALMGPDVHAQVRTGTLRTATYAGVGYVASVPITPLGFSGLIVTPHLFHGAGFLVDVKFTHNSPSAGSDYLPNVTVQQAEVTYGDMLVHEQSDWVTADLAGVYAVTGDFAVYGGAGYSKETHYREYFDVTQTRGEFGFYWVKDPANSGNRVNVMGGFLARLRRFIYFEGGIESAPTAANVGLIIALGR